MIGIRSDTNSTNITDNKSDSTLGTNLTWSDLTLDLLPVPEKEEDFRHSYSPTLENDSSESVNPQSNPVSHFATSECYVITDGDVTRTSFQSNNVMIVRNSHKRQLFSPYGNVQRFLSKDFKKSPHSATVQKAQSPTRHKLLILPNGEVYRKVSFHFNFKITHQEVFHFQLRLFQDFM